MKQEATARFIARHLYNFFVADEPQVPAWPIEPPRDQAAVDSIVKAYFDTGGDMREIMRSILTSDYFKEARFRKVKSPAELVTGVLKLGGSLAAPAPGIGRYQAAAALMGQQLLNPPTVEGWHTGREWIDGGALNERINFAVEHVGDPDKPGVRAIIDRLAENGGRLSPQDFTERCLDLAGPLEVGDDTRGVLMEFAESGGTLDLRSPAERQESVERIIHMLQMIVSSREYQLG